MIHTDGNGEKQPGNDTIVGTKTKSVYQKMSHRVAITMVLDHQEKVFYIGDGKPPRQFPF